MANNEFPARRDIMTLLLMALMVLVNFIRGRKLYLESSACRVVYSYFAKVIRDQSFAIRDSSRRFPCVNQ